MYSIKQLAYLLDETEHTVRRGIQGGAYPFAIAIKRDKKCRYFVNDRKVLEYLGLKENSEKVKNANKLARTSKRVERLRREIESQTPLCSD